MLGDMKTILSGPNVPTTSDRARFKDGVYIELSPRRVRTYFGGKVIGHGLKPFVMAFLRP